MAEYKIEVRRPSGEIEIVTKFTTTNLVGLIDQARAETRKAGRGEILSITEILSPEQIAEQAAVAARLAECEAHEHSRLANEASTLRRMIKARGEEDGYIDGKVFQARDLEIAAEIAYNREHAEEVARRAAEWQALNGDAVARALRGGD